MRLLPSIERMRELRWRVVGLRQRMRPDELDGGERESWRRHHLPGRAVMPGRGR